MEQRGFSWPARRVASVDAKIEPLAARRAERGRANCGGDPDESSLLAPAGLALSANARK